MDIFVLDIMLYNITNCNRNILTSSDWPIGAQNITVTS